MVGISALIASSAIQNSRASDILARSQDILGKATTVVGSFTQQMPQGIGKGDFHLKKDRKLAVYSNAVDELCDGTTRVTFDKKLGTYSVQDVRIFDLVYLPGFEAFTMTERPAPSDKSTWSLVEKFAQDAVDQKRDMEPKEVKMARMDGREVASYVIGGTQVFLDTRTALPVGANFRGDNGQNVVMRFSNVRLNVNLDDSMFTRTNVSGREEKALDRGMLREGDRVPAADVESMRMLDGYMKGKKNTVVVFFDDKNAADSDVLRAMNSLSKKAPKDSAVVAVARTKDWKKMFNGRPKYPVIIDAELPGQSISSRFGVTRFPTVYVVNQDRMVTHVQIGAQDSSLNNLFAVYGISKP